jgi:hypothetical protein
LKACLRKIWRAPQFCRCALHSITQLANLQELFFDLPLQAMRDPTQLPERAPSRTPHNLEIPCKLSPLSLILALSLSLSLHQNRTEITNKQRSRGNSHAFWIARETDATPINIRLELSQTAMYLKKEKEIAPFGFRIPPLLPILFTNFKVVSRSSSACQTMPGIPTKDPDPV